MMNHTSYDAELNVIGLKCPLPILRAKKALALLQTGQVLRILVTDTSAPDDFTAFCRQTGHELLSLVTTDDGVFDILLKHR